MGTTTQNITQTTSNIGPAQLPYYNAAMQNASTLLSQPYQRYGQERIAEFTPEQKQLQQTVLGQQTPGQFGMGTNLAGAAGLGALSAGQQYAQMGGPQSFTQAGLASQYMSPYIQNALDVQRNEAIRGAKQGQLMQDLGAARQGTYGGSRQLLAGMERERNLGQQLSNIEAQGMQQAYENAARQFNTEEAARMQNQQFGANLGLQGLAQAGQAGQTMGNLGQMQGQMDLARLGMQQATAAQQQELNQRYLDTHYQDWMGERDAPYQNLQRYMNILSGVPQSTTSTATTSAPAPSLASQIMGTGLGALGMYKSLSGG